MEKVVLGDVVVFNSHPELLDVTNGKEYKIIGKDYEGYPYFIDDAGDEDFACDGVGLTGGKGTYKVIRNERM